MKKRLKEGDHIRLSGGYDMDPKWLRDRGEYRATVLRFIDNKIEKRNDDERLSAIIEFDETIEFDGLSGKYGMMLLRWKKQKWEPKGTAHVHLLSEDITNIEEMTKENAKWMESHATYERIG